MVASTKKAPARKTPAKKAPAARMTLREAMTALEKAGSAQTRKTYLRHGAAEPLFGVSFATLKELRKRIGVDHELASALWETGNHDARILAVKIADPLRMSPADLDRWVRDDGARMCTNYVAALACEGPHGLARVKVWLAAKDATLRAAGWSLVGALAMQDETLPDAWFGERLTEIEASIHSAPNAERAAMNAALIAIGCRNAATRKSAGAAAKRIGKVEIDHGDTDCKTPDAASYIEKSWTHSTAKGFASPAAQERSREPIRLRC